MIKDVVGFLSQLKQNNNRQWFLEHKPEYQQSKDWLDNLLIRIIEKAAKFDPGLKFLTPSDCTYRQNRDVRFSNDKSPYKTHFAAVLKQGGKKNGETPSYYFQIDSQGKLFVGGGWYIMDSKELFKLRSNILKEPQKFLKTIQTSNFKKAFKELSGEKLTGSPRGFSKDDPNIELLKYKHYIAFRETDISKFSETELEDYILESFEALVPLVQYLLDIKNLEV